MRRYIFLLFLVFLTSLGLGRSAYAVLQDVPAELPSTHKVQFPFDFLQKSEAQKLKEELGLADKDTLKDLTPKQLGNHFYDYCKDQSVNLFYQDAKDAFCACSAAGLSDYTEKDDIFKMTQEGADGNLARETFVASVMSLCIKSPLKQIMYNECVRLPEIRGAYRNYAKVCQCRTDSMYGYLFDNLENELSPAWDLYQFGKPLFFSYLVVTYLSKPGYAARDKSSFRNCVYLEEYQWQNYMLEAEKN